MAKAKKISTPKKTTWTDEEKLFSSKSKLINLDLSKFFSTPEAWSVLDETEKVRLRALLPPHVELEDDGSIPLSFLKYDTDWRNAVRQFKIDLGAGRYEPLWLEEAAQAMEERAAGIYDSFKEAEYEVFWGAKQKVAKFPSGEMATLKLSNLVNANSFQVGDVWSYSRNFGRTPNEKVQVEKDCLVTAIAEGTLTFLIPPAQDKFLKLDCYPEDQLNLPVRGQIVQTIESSQEASEGRLPDSQTLDIVIESTAQCLSKRKSFAAIFASEPSDQSSETHLLQEPINMSSKRPKTSHESTCFPPLQISEGESMPLTTQTASVARAGHLYYEKISGDTVARESSAVSSLPTSSLLSTAPSSCSVSPETQTRSRAIEDPSLNPRSATEPSYRPPPTSTLTIATPRALETRIIQVDGRIQNPPADNSWRNFRMKRMEQDIGSLWEIREEFWVRQHAR